VGYAFFYLRYVVLAVKPAFEMFEHGTRREQGWGREKGARVAIDHFILANTVPT
jgi:hypothetical protein